MSKPKSIYVQDNVDNIIQKIESQIDSISHTIDLYGKKNVQKKMNTVNFNILSVSEN